MRSLAILAVGAAVAFAGAAQAQGQTKGDPDAGYAEIRKEREKRFPIGQSWIAISLNGKTFSGVERPGFTLDEQFRVRGFGGCNTFSATAFPLREQGIAVGPLALTRRNCPKEVMAAELAFLTALRTSAKWDTQIGSLIIKGPNGELKFERSL